MDSRKTTRRCESASPLGSLWLWAGAFLVLLGGGPPAKAVDFVIQISVDGLGSSYLQNLINLGEAPNFARFQTQGVWTNNARTDFDSTITLPNHVSILTGRPVMNKFSLSTTGHIWESNADPGVLTLHGNRGFYLSSIFDVAHDNGRSTSLYATKGKFVLFDQSYNATAGAPDVTGVDNGRDKIDVYLNPDSDSAAMMSGFLSNMMASPTRTNYSFLHFHDPDTIGHTYGWGSTLYNNSLKAVDGHLGAIFNLINTNPMLLGRTAIILTSDHGGVAGNHQTNTDPLTYTIPFYVWGAGVAAGADLYSLNSATRLNPGTGQPDYSGSIFEPIRNGDGGNLALRLLGLGPIPGSRINSSQNLAVPEPDAVALMMAGALAAAGAMRLRRGSAAQ